MAKRTSAVWSAYLAHLIADPGFIAVRQKYVPIGLQGERFRSLSRDFDDDDDGGTAIEDAIAGDDRMVLLGEPGAGKTWALQHLAHSMAERAAEDDAVPIPIYVELRVWGARPRGAAAATELLDILAAKVHARLAQGMAFTRDDLQHELTADTFLLVFDGLDEVRQPGDRIDLLQAIVELIGDGRHSCVIGSRRYGFADDARSLLAEVGFSVYEPQRLDPSTKRKIVRKYVGSDRDADEAMNEISRSYQHARLSDNVLLLRIMAEQYAAEHELPRTRGQLLRRYTDGCIGRIPLLKPKAETARDIFMQFAETMRSSQQTHLLETAQVVPIISERATWHGVSGSELLDALLETRIIERLEVSTHSAITFALPQYEDYFLARKALVSLENDIRSGSRAVHANEYVANRELHHVLIVAAGLLQEREAEALVGTLDDRNDIFLKARILGEADAPRSERLFVDHQERKLKTAIRKALKDISRLWLLLLLLWTIAFLPLSYALDSLWRWKWWVATLVFAAHAIGIPLILQQLHRHVLGHFAARVQIIIPEVLRALSFVRTGDVRVRLRRLRSSVEEQRPGGGRRAGDDVYMSLLDRIEKEISRTIDLADRDLDTLLDEIRRNPLLIRQYLGLAPDAFVEMDVEITAEYARTSPGDDTKTAVLCVEKLHRVANTNARLRRNVIDALQRVADEATEVAVATAAGDAVRELTTPVARKIEAPAVLVVPRAVIVVILLLIVCVGAAVWIFAGGPETSKIRDALVVGFAVTMGGILVNTISDYLRSNKRPSLVTLALLLGFAVLMAAAAFLFN